MEFFIQIQLHMVVSNNECCSICSSVEKREVYFNFGAIFEYMPWLPIGWNDSIYWQRGWFYGKDYYSLPGIK